jgi:3-deoxy-7-phosphoheptulonate synthase
LCERGIRSAVTEGTRNVLDIQSIPYIKKHSKFPIIVDPSHSSGLSYMVVPMSKASLISGADGLLIESHYNPKMSLSDKNQTISIKELNEIVKFNNEFKNKL